MPNQEKKRNEEETKMGQYGHAERNERRHTLINYLKERQLFGKKDILTKSRKKMDMDKYQRQY